MCCEYKACSESNIMFAIFLATMPCSICVPGLKFDLYNHPRADELSVKHRNLSYFRLEVRISIHRAMNDDRNSKK